MTPSPLAAAAADTNTKAKVNSNPKPIINASKLLIIGDIHGHSHKLTALLEQADFDPSDSDSAARDSQLLFVGDLIDNGLDGEQCDQLALLQQVKALVDGGFGHCILGNHELNAIGWLTRRRDGRYGRDRNKPSNLNQHQQFLSQVGQDSGEHNAWIEWFKTLPLFIETESLRAIHACWHQPSIDKLKPYLHADNSLKAEFWPDAFDPQHPLFQLLETLLKGPEVKLPNGLSFHDKNGTERHHLRVAWWQTPAQCHSFADIAVPGTALPDSLLSQPIDGFDFGFNLAQLKPVFIGHYYLPVTPYPQPLSLQVACIDFSASKADAPLLGYWFSADQPQLDGADFCGQAASGIDIDAGVAQLLESQLASLPPYQPNRDLAEAVTAVLLQQWDPIGVSDFGGACDDEYHAYVEDLCRLIQAQDGNGIGSYLLLVERHLMGVERDEAAECCAEVAYALLGLA
ncbi:metallophosphoesterase [uncultured Ferrimonas sp.]|uniref:metallophosphoesterase n=1 Tax=uncultured Ferrimonas sp. TaxID=432640 RepID=UPI0026320AC2|nr:metallophosphoesterase [uncultured Ferrimonas sp.]